MLGCLGPYVELQHTARHTERCHFKKKQKKNTQLSVYKGILN